MTIDNYLIFIVACIVLCVVPGPDMIYLLSRTIAQGKKAGVAATVGMNVGGYFHLTAAILGISVVIATSSFAFTLLKWCGATYLIYIGLQAILSKSTLKLNENHKDYRTLKTIFWQGFISDALNPKVAIFFVSLLPQFIQPEEGNTLGQLLLLGITVNLIALTINLAIVIFSHSVTKRLRQTSRISKYLKNAMGFIFIGLGLRLANERQ